MSDPSDAAEALSRVHWPDGLKRYLVGLAISLTTAILAQSVILVWWAATISTRLDHVEKDLDGVNARVHAIEIGRPGP